MNRIKWDEDTVKGEDTKVNKCQLVWQGMSKQRDFPDFKYKAMKTEEMVREFFKRHNCQHYFDVCLSGVVLEAVNTDD